MTAHAIDAIVLAGGGSSRLLHITRALGEPSETSLCRFGGSRSLLQRCLDRLVRLGAISHTSVAIRRDQWTLAAEQVQRYRAVSLLAQPCDRGTGAAVLTGLLGQVRRQSSLTLIAACDHMFANEELVLDVLDEAIAAVLELGVPVIIGAEADRPAGDRGWIVPMDGSGRAVPVKQLAHPRAAGEVAERSPCAGLGNTMLMVAPTESLLAAFEAQAPETFATLLPAALIGADGQRDVFLRWAFSQIDELDFSRDVVPGIRGLHVSRLPRRVGWTDLGDERRLIEWLERCGSPMVHRARRATMRSVPPCEHADVI